MIRKLVSFKFIKIIDLEFILEFLNSKYHTVLNLYKTRSIECEIRA